MNILMERVDETSLKMLMWQFINNLPTWYCSLNTSLVSSSLPSQFPVALLIPNFFHLVVSTVVLLSSRSPKRTDLPLLCLCNRAIRGSYQISQHNLSLNSKTVHISFPSKLVYHDQNHWPAFFLFCNTDTIFAISKHMVEVLPLKVCCWPAVFMCLFLLVFLLCLHS